ncbi:hypothetical protein G7Z17_g10716 [Cylindrodendrum hubeiense]|uniref:Uncharacterized protein n=1 Tax=Cylindrodendrum hubeiense TaxID=595255 RepID=A0A9P5L715_9HYPO|nr:hypothetical protein G7Z17_g10716 [Cylindrodendrum hubeiense]
MRKTRQRTRENTQRAASGDGKKEDDCSPQKRRRGPSNATATESSAAGSSSEMPGPSSAQAPPSDLKKEPGSILKSLSTIGPSVDAIESNEAQKLWKGKLWHHELIAIVTHCILSLPDDDAVCFHFWEDLHKAIEHFAETLSGNLLWNDLDESTQEKFNSWTPDAYKVFGIYDGGHKFFTSWVWRILADSIFNSKSPKIKWASSYFKAQHEMENFVLDAESQLCLDRLATFAVILEMNMARRLANPQLIFHHPETKQISGFEFQPEIDGWELAAMLHERHAFFRCTEEEEIAENRSYQLSHAGRTVDFVVAPMVIVPHFCKLYKDQFIGAPMVVCVDWVAAYDKDVEKEERKKEAKAAEKTAAKEKESENGKGKGKVEEKGREKGKMEAQ